MRETTELSLREVLQRMMGYNIVCILVLLVTSAAFPGSHLLCTVWLLFLMQEAVCGDPPHKLMLRQVHNLVWFLMQEALYGGPPHKLMLRQILVVRMQTLIS